VNILYAGARNTADIEHNGLTLNGVGNGTKIQNVYVLESADDAIEFFGGTVNVTNLLAVNPDDDMFDFTQGTYLDYIVHCILLSGSRISTYRVIDNRHSVECRWAGNYHTD